MYDLKDDIREVKGLLENATQEVVVKNRNMQTQIDNMRAEMQVTPGMRGVGTSGTAQDDFAGRFTKAWQGGGAERFKGTGQAIFNLGQFLETKTTITSGTVGSSTPGILVPSRVPGVVAAARTNLVVRDLLRVATTQNNAIEWVKENQFTNASSPQVEASDKGESGMTFEIVSAPVRTIASWIPATRQVLDDAPELDRYIRDLLVYGLEEQIDYQLLRGDGVGVHFSGLVTQATTYAGTYNIASDTRLDKLNHAIAELAGAKVRASGLVLHPVDWANLQVLKTNAGGANTGEYLLSAPGATPQQVLWGLPVALTTALPLGSFLVGDFQYGAQIFDRMATEVAISTEHDSYFVKNLVAIRAEWRGVLAVYRPWAFVYGTF
jgi:HK97 family phage major capsid protein